MKRLKTSNNIILVPVVSMPLKIKNFTLKIATNHLI